MITIRICTVRRFVDFTECFYLFVTLYLQRIHTLSIVYLVNLISENSESLSLKKHPKNYHSADVFEKNL